jgi:hypothetical protein
MIDRSCPEKRERIDALQVVLLLAFLDASYTL